MGENACAGYLFAVLLTAFMGIGAATWGYTGRRTFWQAGRLEHPEHCFVGCWRDGSKAVARNPNADPHAGVYRWPDRRPDRQPTGMTFALIMAFGMNFITYWFGE